MDKGVIYKMAKSKKLLSIYLLGMILTLVGFICPMFKFFLGQSLNGFNFIDFNHSGPVSIGALLIFIGSIVGIASCLLDLKKLGILRLVSVCATLAGVIIIVIGCLNNAFYKAIGEHLIKNALVGFYLCAAGIVISIIGYLKNK